MITIYHNQRCSKSRECYNILDSKQVDFEVIKYLEEPLSKAKLQEIIKMLNIKPIELVRKNEAIWKEKYKGKEMDDTAVVEALVQYPKLIERPIVINGNKAVIGRPPEKVLEIL